MLSGANEEPVSPGRELEWVPGAEGGDGDAGPAADAVPVRWLGRPELTASRATVSWNC